MLLILKTALAAMIGVAGAAKLFGAKPIALQFAEFGLSAGAMRLVGALEVAAAVGLWVAPFWAACGIALLMLGAVANHAKVRHPAGQFAPSIVVLALAVAVALTV